MLDGLVAWRVTMWAVLITFLLTAGGMLWWGIKREAAREERFLAEQALYRKQHAEDLEAISALSSGLGAMRDGYETLSKDRSRLNRQLERIKKDEATRVYLSQPVPDGLRNVLKNSECLQLPGSCKPDQTYDSGVPGDKHD